MTVKYNERDSLRAWMDSRRADMDPSGRANWDETVAALEGNLKARYEAARSRFRRDPTGSALRLALLAVDMRRPREALQALEHVDRNAPIWRDFPPIWTFLPMAHHMVGSYEEALEVARQGIERFPENLELRINELRALAAMGRLSEMKPLWDQVERMEPNYGRTPGAVFRNVAWELDRFGFEEESRAVAERSLDWFLARDPERYPRPIAEALLLLDRADEAPALLEPLLEESPEIVFHRGVYGVALALTGDQIGAEAQERRLESMEISYSPGENTRWRAAIAAHLGRKDEAVRLLWKAFDEGLPYNYYGLESAYPYFKPLWDYEPFEQLIAPKG